jgi:hypothetical protein
MRCLVLALLVWVAACAHVHRMPPVPGKGGPAWREVTSEHFILWTDLPETEARSALRHIESFRDVVINFVFSGMSRLPSKSLVIALRRFDDWALFGNPNIVGFFRPLAESPLNVPFLAYEAERHSQSGYTSVGGYEYYWEKNANPTTIVQHELGHLLMHALVKDPPAWLDEGIASYFETVDIDEKAGQAEVGRLPKDLVERLTASPMDPVHHVVLSAKGTDRHQPGFYLRSHVLVSYLLNREAQRFATYQRVLKQVPPGPASHEAVWQKVFGDRSAFALQGDVDNWLASGTLTLTTFRLSGRSLAVSQARLLSDADVYTIRALLFLALGGDAKAEDAVKNTEAAITADANHLVGNLMHAVLTKRADAERARAVVAAHPNDWRSWLLLGIAAKNDDEHDEAVRRICEILAQDPTQHAPSEDLCEKN